MPNLAMHLAVAALALGATTVSAQGVPQAPPPPRWTNRAPQPPEVPDAPDTPPALYGEGVSRIDTVVAFAQNGSIELSLISGSMKVSTWNRNEVRVVATTSGPPTLQFDADRSHLSLEDVKKGYSSRGRDVGTATYEVTVPTGVRATLSAVSGDINAAGMHGRVEANVVSGNIDVRNVGTSLYIQGVSGNITVANVGGDAHVENVSGRISVTNVGGTSHIETVSGDILVSGARGDRFQATSVSGDLEFVGALTSSSHYEFETHSGSTRLRLASNANGTVRVETFSGSVSSNYPGAVRQRDSGDDGDSHDVQYMIGKGAGRIHIETFSGEVHISQGNQ